MLIKEIIYEAEKIIGESIYESDDDLLLRCYNLIENELALDYFPLIHVETFICKGGIIKFKDFSKIPHEISQIYDSDFKSLSFRVYADHIKILDDVKEYACIVYLYSPAQKTIEDASDYSEKYKDILIYGIISEYFLMIGEYEKAMNYNKLYSNEINLLKNNEN